ncbi:MAG TPA: glycosyltransferase family 2 protein [Sphingobacteriaceae bacterium]
MPLVSVITINYNNTDVTEELLASLPTGNDSFKLEVIVVDNGSSPDPVPAWKEKYPHFAFIRSEINLGFSKGNNLGIKKSSGEFLFLVNNDTVFTEDLIPQMLRVFQQNSRIGIASPKIYYFGQEKMIQYAGFTEMNMLTGRNRCIGQFETDEGQYDEKTGPTGYVHGAAMMVRREVLTRAGMMPEDFFLYYEEMDWCEKIRAAGYEVWVVPTAVIYHKESVSVGKSSALKEYYMNRNRILFIRRNASAVKRLGFYLYFLLIVTPRNIFNYLRAGRYEFIPVLLRAIGWNLFNNKTRVQPVSATELK